MALSLTDHWAQHLVSMWVHSTMTQLVDSSEIPTFAAWDDLLDAMLALCWVTNLVCLLVETLETAWVYATDYWKVHHSVPLWVLMTVACWVVHWVVNWESSKDLSTDHHWDALKVWMTVAQ